MEQLTENKAFIRSDALADFRRLLSDVPPIKRAFGNLIQIQVVIDASIVQEELRWRLHSRRDPSARSSLEESIHSGTIIAFAPTALKREIEEHITEIAADAPVHRAFEEWRAFESNLHFYEPDMESSQTPLACVDTSDWAYEQVRDQLGALAVYTRDSHFEAMQVPVITVRLGLLCRDYARAASVQVGIMLGANFTIMVSIETLVALARSAFRGFQRLPTAIKLGIAAAAIFAALHPGCRQKVSEALRSIWSQLTNAKSPLMIVLAELARQAIAAQETVAKSSAAIKSALPPTKKRPALAHARAVCLVNRSPLSLGEIERRMKSEGYVSKSGHFSTYLQRVLRADNRFVEVSKGLWTLKTETWGAISGPMTQVL